MTKPSTAYTAQTKPSTAYQANDDAGITLGDTTVTLGNTSYRLNGFTTAEAPNQISEKQATAYGEI